MTLTQAITSMFSKRASSPAQRAVNSGAPDAAENPTDGQRRVGNYQKVHLNIDGFRISIENPKGSVRSGTASDGTKWSNTLACDYGDIRGTEDVDGDPVDIYLSDHPEKGAVFVIDQIDPKTKKFDEHKVMYGFDSIEDAKKTYLACYQKGWGGLGWITPVTKAEFRKWIDSSTRKTKPFHEYASVTPIVDPIKVKAAQAKVEDNTKGVNNGLKPPASSLPENGIEYSDSFFRDILPELRRRELGVDTLPDSEMKMIRDAASTPYTIGDTSVSGPDSVGFYNPVTNTIVLSDKSDQLARARVLSHERMHALHALRKRNGVSLEGRLKKLHDHYKFNDKRVDLPAYQPSGEDDMEDQEVQTTNIEHQMRRYIGLAQKLGRLPTSGEYISSNENITGHDVVDERFLRPVNGYEAHANRVIHGDNVKKVPTDFGDGLNDDSSFQEFERLRETYKKIGGKRPSPMSIMDEALMNLRRKREEYLRPIGQDQKNSFIDLMNNVGRVSTPMKVGPVGAYKTAQATDGDNPMEGVPAGVKLRSFIDAPATRTAIMDNVLEAVKNRFPIEDDDVRLELKDVKYEGPTSYTLEQQKQALLGNRRLGCSIAGTWRLIDKKTGNVLDERRDGVIRVPYYTDRGTIINNGNEYTVISQARLSPGVYVRRKQNGELESQFNVANGLGFRIGLNKETGALNMSVGQGHVPLYPILSAMGVSDDDIRKSWGDEVALVNIGKFDPRAMDKVYARYAGRKADMNLSPAEKAKFVTEALAGSGLDPDVVVRTLGLENVTGVTGQVMLRAAQKLLNINRGAEDPDERDNPRFSKFYGVEDMMRERIDKDSGRLTKSMLFRAKRDKSLARIGRNALAPYLDTFLSGSGLAMPGEEANPLSILTQQSRITRLGEGGISSPDLVTPEARNVQGDYLGYVDFISGPESFGIGIDVRAALGTMKGSDNRLYNKMMDLRTGKTRYVALDDAASHTVAFPGQDPKAPRLYAMRKGVPTMVPREEVDFMVPGFGNTVSAGINMTPMPTAVQAGRQFYMSKFWEQYLPQKEGEVPLVDSLMDDGKTTYSEFYGRKIGCLTAPFAGTVIKANDKEIVIRGKDGQTHTASLVQGLPFNRMTSITFNSQVKKGDTVEEGGILANSNFTDAKTGAMNMGRNLKVAVLPAPKGVSSYEDAIVISESAAKKLATSRTYGFEQDTKEGVKVARNKYLAAFPKTYTKEQAETIDDNGVVKVGTVLHRDDPMILAIGPKMLSAEDAQLGKLSSVLRNSLTDKSQKWEHDWPGVVTDVVAGAHGVRVLVKSEPPVKVGDKLSPEDGLKGVVGGVLEDDKMPRDAVTNEPYDMLMNPMGFLSRVAPGQIMLMNLAKVAKKTGKQIRIPQTPPPEGWQNWVEQQMAANGIKETADVFDPQTGRTIKDVGDGYAYVKAFHHLAEKKFSARGVEGSYTQDEQPAKGGHDGAKRVSGFDSLSLLSHGATDVLKDSMTLRGQMNSDYWRRYRLGLPVEEPGVPFIYQKFINTLKAGGVNVVEKGDVTSIMPQTDADIDELAQGRVLETSQMVDSDFQPVKGGMFDLGKTGGMGGNRWSMITLPEAVPNPMMEEPVRRVLGLTSKKMEAILSGREELNGKTGGDAIKDALANINIDREIEKARADVQNRRGSQRDNAVKVLGYLKAAKDMGKKPEEWMITRVPVIPPMFRPVAKMGDVALVPDMNELYKELIEMKDNYEALAKELPASALADERLAVYGAVKAAYGLGEPITTEGRAKNLKGAIRQVIGQIPKFGQFQSKVISKTQDLVGRSVITPNRNLDMDQIGIPEEMAWEIFKPFVERKLVQRGYAPLTVKNMIEERNATAKHILEDVMDERPVLMDRAPTWHKFNIMAFKPHITKGRSINVCPLVCSGFNADFDGNCVDYDSLLTVRMSKSAFDNAKKICDNILHTNQEKEYAMTDANTSIRIVDENKVEMTVKIGTFPRVGEPRLDKNGAMVYAVPEGIEVLSVDPVTGIRSFEPVSMFTHESDCDTVKVTYGSKSVIVSSNESLAVFDSKEGHLVRVKPIESENRLTPVLVSSSDKFGSFGDRDLGWLFGAFISDGWSSDRCIGYTKLEKCKREEFVRILRAKHENFNLHEYVGHKGEGNKLGDSVKIHCNSSTVAEWIHQWRFINDDFSKAKGARAALFKMIDHKLIESGSEEFLWGLLSGLLDGDGNIPCNMHTKKPRYTFRFNTSSPYLRDDLCRLMHKLGLRYSVTTVKARGWSNESYVVYPSTVDMFGKIGKLSCIGEIERSRIEGFRSSVGIPKDDADVVPVSEVEFEAIRKLPGFKTGGSLYTTLIRTKNEGAMRAARSSLMRFIDCLKNDESTKGLAERVLNTNTKWMKISSVEDAGKRDVFDLEVATTKTFVINDGVVVWDTVNIHVPASEKAAKQALEKMLPSKNLFSLTDMKSVRYKPEKEQISGLWALTRGRTKRPTRYFNSKAEAIAAYRNGEIGPNDPIEIIDMKGS